MLREGLLLKKRSDTQWFLSLGPVGVVASFGIPVQVVQSDVGEVVRLKLQLQESDITWLIAFDLSDWRPVGAVALSVLADGELGLANMSACIAGVVGDADVSLLEHSAWNCFWDIPLIGLKQVAQHSGVVAVGTTLCSVLDDIVRAVLPGISEEQRISILELRIKGSKADEELMTYLQCDFVKEGFASSDQKEVADSFPCWWCGAGGPHNLPITRESLVQVARRHVVAGMYGARPLRASTCTGLSSVHVVRAWAAEWLTPLGRCHLLIWLHAYCVRFESSGFRHFPACESSGRSCGHRRTCHATSRTHAHHCESEAEFVVTVANKKADSLRSFVNDVAALRQRMRALTEGAAAKRGGKRSKAKAAPKKDKRHIAKLPETEDISYMFDLLPPSLGGTKTTTTTATGCTTKVRRRHALGICTQTEAQQYSCCVGHGRSR